MTNELSPERLAELLKGNERQHFLTPNQRAALWSRVEMSASPEFRNEESSDADSDISIIASPTSQVTLPAPTRSNHAFSWVARAAAALLLAVGGYGVSSLRSPDQTEVVVAAATTTSEPTRNEIGDNHTLGSAPCPREVQALLDGITVWETVENWSYLTDDRAPAPDLVLLADDALALHRSASEVLPNVRALSASRDAGTLSYSSHDRRTLRSTIEAAVDEVTAWYDCP